MTIDEAHTHTCVNVACTWAAAKPAAKQNLVLQQQLSHYEEHDGLVQWQHLVHQASVVGPVPKSNYELGTNFGACVLDTWFSTPSFKPCASEDADEVFERVAGGPVAWAGSMPTLGASTGGSATCTKK